ncbi:DUF6297 family protein [Kribbella italica]|uniref:Uncharacterized protein n=1 Tax=Kribbella italica TaxID=1540520 RepID=A0A7W9J1P9_9ACTN|nr:DUF6297 family protein [Kribbella italica]MBB5834021.1 hypothetical protein [Kribbella italica]
MSAADGPVVFDPADFGPIPRSAELRRWMRKVRRGKADRTFWQQFEDIYLVIFALAMLGASGGNVVRHLNENSASCANTSCSLVVDYVPFILLPLLVAGMLRILLSVGPVSASRATGFWLLATPVDRGAVLRPAYRLVITVAAVLGALFAVVGFAVFGASLWAVIEATMVATALLVCVACATVWAQQSPTAVKWTLRIADGFLVLAAIAALALAIEARENAAWQESSAETLIATVYGTGTSSGLSLQQQRVLVLGAACLVVAAAAVVMTARSLARLPKQSLVAGGDLLAGMAGAAITMDVSLLADIVAGRHWRTVGRLKSRRGRGERVQAIIHREFRRVLRWPRRLIVGAGLLVVPYAVAGTGYDVLVPIAAGFAGFVAARPLMDGLRSVCRSTGLVRALGMDLKDLRIAMSVVPAGFVILWTLAAGPALGDAPTTFAVAAGILTGVVRQASARPPSYAGPLVASPMGAIPPGLFSQPIRGFDLLLLCLLPVLFGLPPLWCYVIPGIVLAFMFSLRPKTDAPAPPAAPRG